MFMDAYLKPSCTWMLICTVHSDVLIIFLLKTCWHYPGDTRNVNAAFPVKFGPMGTMRVSVCCPWLVGPPWRCTTVRRALAASRATTGSSGSSNSHCNLQSHPFWRNRNYFYFVLYFFFRTVHVCSRQPISPVLGALPPVLPRARVGLD